VSVEHDQLVGIAPEAANQRVDLTGTAQLVEPAEAMEHGLHQAPLAAFVFDQEEVGAGAIGLGADEHGGLLRAIRTPPPLNVFASSLRHSA
jgi:hypothetical protein